MRECFERNGFAQHGYKTSCPVGTRRQNPGKFSGRRLLYLLQRGHHEKGNFCSFAEKGRVSRYAGTLRSYAPVLVTWLCW